MGEWKRGLFPMNELQTSHKHDHTTSNTLQNLCHFYWLYVQELMVQIESKGQCTCISNVLCLNLSQPRPSDQWIHGSRNLMLFIST